MHGITAGASPSSVWQAKSRRIPFGVVDLDAEQSRLGAQDPAIALKQFTRSLRHCDRVAHDSAEVFTHVVVTRFPRLHPADLVGGPRHQAVSALLAHIPTV